MNKIIKMFGNMEFIITKEEADKIFEINNKDDKAFIRLSTGEMIRVNGIEAIIDPPRVPFWGGYELSKDSRGYSFMRDGQRCYLEQHNLKEIEFKDDLKYQQIDKVKLLQ